MGLRSTIHAPGKCVTTPEGQNVEKRPWNELVEKLEKIGPGVTQNLEQRRTYGTYLLKWGSFPGPVQGADGCQYALWEVLTPMFYLAGLVLVQQQFEQESLAKGREGSRKLG
ncbi:hypothetical protein FIBSPDRAFT_902113 [Athelia psychrophila]|uniref:Uncharacterized protein n=1 Tax=Athelia psychrophila TaxID=1759441 RepID=A0A167XML8_9AGAM|nr:hypothetical protein FIBSPDRAFT_902113 [Fibularhizoctonia sp. CBS 109695]